MAKAPKHERVIAYGLMNILRPLRVRWATGIYLHYLQKWGAKFEGGKPNYISSKTDIDGTDYSLITLGEGVTISSYVRLLTHDWSPYTVGKAMEIYTDKPLGHIRPIRIGAFSFVGTGSIVMPGCNIGRGCIIGAGTVARGNIPDYSLVIGSPGKVIGDTRDYMQRHFPDYADKIEQARAAYPEPA